MAQISSSSSLSKKERYKKVIEWFSINMPVAETELDYNKDPYQLLVAVILSAQCTDKRVNMITPAFFNKFPDVYKLAEGSFDEVFNLIRSCSYPNNKSKNLMGMAKTLVNDFEGNVPSNTDDLQKLPGVGRKTANVIASVIYHKPVFAVDTHVFRTAGRIGLSTNAKTPLQTEMQLMKYIPEDIVSKAHHWLILHGRYICTARNPKCHSCGLTAYCIYYNKSNYSGI